MAIGIKQIADKAGVHPSTVSLALRGSKRLPEETKSRIAKIAAQLDYRPNYMAKGLAGQKTKTIGIVVPKLRDLYVVDVIAAQEKWLQQRGYAALLVVTHVEPEAERKAIDDFMGRGVDALAFDYVPNDPEILKEIQSIANSGIPVSFLGTTDLENVDEVTWDGFKAGYEIGKYLISLGHKRIATIGLDSSDTRGIGCRKALQESGIPIDSQLDFQVDYVFQDVTQLRKDVMSLKERPTAIFAYNDDLAGELMYELIEMGYRVPEDVSIIGVNDGWYSPRLRVPLTTYHLSPEQFGITVVESALNRILNPQTPVNKKIFEGYLVVRSSTGPNLVQNQ